MTLGQFLSVLALTLFALGYGYWRGLKTGTVMTIREWSNFDKAGLERYMNKALGSRK